MKKYIFAILLLPLALLGSCTAEEGADPGTDKAPAVTVYTYEPTDESANPDNDIQVRFATNAATTGIYYLVEKTDDVNKFIEANGENAYIQKVIENGTNIPVNGAENIDRLLTGIVGVSTITAVATNGSTSGMGTASFTGLDWADIVSGQFVYNAGSFLAAKGADCVLQRCTVKDGLYRLKDAFGEGYSMKFTATAQKGSTAEGTFTHLRVGYTPTPWTIRFTSDPAPTTLYVEDVSTWQGKTSFMTNYPCGMYDNYKCFFTLAWMGGNKCTQFEPQSIFTPDQAPTN